MTDTLDKVIDAAKKLRKYAKKSADPAFVNLIADLNMQLADLRVQLAERKGTDAPAAATPAPEAAARVSPATQVGSNFDSIFDRDDTN
jgi:hypothetical protein